MSQIEKQLDQAYAEGMRQKLYKAFAAVGEGLNTSPINIMVSGQSGFGKTSMIRQWAETNSDKFNFVEFDASLMSLKTVDNTAIVFSESDIDRLSQPNTVVFIDNYHLLKPDVEKELNRFFDDRIVRDGSRGEISLDDVVFAVVAVTV